MSEMRSTKRIGGSFRDPNGFVFVYAGSIYREVNERYRRNFEALTNGGLYDDLRERRLLLAHSEVFDVPRQTSSAYKVIRPEQIPFISYPYEWSFSQLKDAALTTLKIQKRSLAFDMILKDASAYNIQFLDGNPLLIDTLSFERYQKGQAWIAYKQFCQHFLAPLVLMSHVDIRLSQQLRIHLDGIPLDLATTLLPKRALLNTGVLMHLQLHSIAQRRYKGKSTSPDGNSKRLSKESLVNITDDLHRTIRRLSWNHSQTSWAGYCQGDSYEEAGFLHKTEIVGEFLDVVKPKCVWDLGANTGAFSRIASAQGAFTVSIDNDPGAVEANYLRAKHDNMKNIHPLLVDLTNPSANIGWSNDERASLSDRSNADCLLVLALIHHLAIGNNLPLSMTAEFFASLAEWLIIEFVPKSDKKVQLLLATREDVFADYCKNTFEEIYKEYFNLVDYREIDNSDRVLYLCQRRNRI